MSLADVMGGSGLSVWAEAGLLISLLVFTCVTIATFRRRNRETFERARFLPLHEDTAGRAAGPHERT